MKQKETPKKQWNNIYNIIMENRSDISALLTDDTLRLRMQFFAVFIIFIVVSAVMTVVNLLTDYDLLGWSTFLFALLNLFNIIFILANEKMEKLSRTLFAFEIVALFSFFLITGEPEGFSAIWIALLPACGLLLYRLKYGSIISIIQLLILCFLFWTKPGNSLLMYDYTSSFLLRFPILYVAFFFIGFFFEFIRHTTQTELSEMRSRFERLSKHDPLTGLFNRAGFKATLEDLEPSENGCAFAIIDFDSFKSINDTYGHNGGDLVLTDSADLIRDAVKDAGCVCRWGGDEMSVFFYSKAAAAACCQTILEGMRAHSFDYCGTVFHTTVSIGLATVEVGQDFALTDLIAVADNNLYVSKGTGKNQLIISAFDPSLVPENADQILD